MASKLETNIALQPRLIQALLSAERPGWMKELRGRRVFFVGIGTSYHAAQIAVWLWRRYVAASAQACHSFDFVGTPQPVAAGDVVVLISHSGTKSYSTQAAKKAREMKAVTVGVTCKGSPWQEGLDHRLETCEREDIGVFTKSFTAAMAWFVRWIDEPELSSGVAAACAALKKGPQFPALRRETDLVLLGDLAREWVAREIALKTQEAAYLRSRAFGLEEFLHGPRISTGEGSQVIAFVDSAEKRWEAVRRFLKTVEVPLLEARPGDFGVPEPAGWLWQTFWGQRLTLDACLQVGANPDTLRTEDPRYKLAREELTL